MKRDALVTRFPFFYGWIIAAVGTIGFIMSSPGQTYAVSLFIEHFITDLGISRTVVSTLYSAGTLIGSFALPYIGKLIDKQGERRMIVIISIIFAIACVWLGAVQNVVMLMLGFISIRMFGQGSLTLVSQIAINQWWVRHRGRILGISGVVVSLVGLGLFPKFIIFLIEILGWRHAYMALGVLIFLVMVPLGWIFIRHKPEEYGLTPDGEEVDEEHSIHEVNFTRREALRDPAFWIVSLGLASVAMLTTGLFFHQVSIFQDAGQEVTIIGTVFLVVAFANAIFNLGSGILIDHIRAKWILFVSLLGQSASLILSLYLQSFVLVVIYAVILGATSGLTRTLNTVIWAKYYGREHLGEITGVSLTILVVGSALGPMPLGIIRDIFGNYTFAMYGGALLPLILAGLSLTIKRGNP